MGRQRICICIFPISPPDRGSWGLLRERKETGSDCSRLTFVKDVHLPSSCSFYNLRAGSSTCCRVAAGRGHCCSEAILLAMRTERTTRIWLSFARRLRGSFYLSSKLTLGDIFSSTVQQLGFFQMIQMIFVIIFDVGFFVTSLHCLFQTCASPSRRILALVWVFECNRVFGL